MSGMVPVSLACPDWQERLRAGKPPIPDLPLNLKEADQAAAIFNNFRLPDVPGQPAMRDKSGDWTKALVRNVFGTVDDTLDRFVREFFVLVPKKNAKTTTGAGIMLTALLMNRRPNGEFLLIGPTQEIADTAFMQASGMIEADPEGWLQKRFNIQHHQKTITDRTNGARLKIKTFDTKVMTGAKPVGVLIDEIHVLGTFSYAAKVLAQVTGGILANPEGFVIYITTQSDAPPAGAFRTKLDLARAVRDGKAGVGEGNELGLLPVLYEFPKEFQADENEPWTDPTFWPLVLPNLGRSITMDRLQQAYRSAREEGREALSIWASQHLNIEIGIALSATGWDGAPHWQAASYDGGLTIERMMELCEVVVAGIDGGGLDDLLGLCIAGRIKGSDTWLFLFRAWAHQVALDRRPKNRAVYDQFAREGSLTICAPGEETRDIDEIVALLAELNDAGLLPDKAAVGLDPFGVSSLLDAMVEAGLTEEQMIGVGQGYKLNGAIKGMARKLMDGRLRHDGSALMAWTVSNAKAEVRGNSIVVTKQLAGSAKIDALIAGFNAFTLMSMNPQAGEAASASDYFKSLAAVA